MFRLKMVFTAGAISCIPLLACGCGRDASFVSEPEPVAIQDFGDPEEPYWEWERGLFPSVEGYGSADMPGQEKADGLPYGFSEGDRVTEGERQSYSDYVSGKIKDEPCGYSMSVYANEILGRWADAECPVPASPREFLALNEEARCRFVLSHVYWMKAVTESSMPSIDGYLEEALDSMKEDGCPYMDSWNGFDEEKLDMARTLLEDERENRERAAERIEMRRDAWRGDQEGSGYQE